MVDDQASTTHARVRRDLRNATDAQHPLLGFLTGNPRTRELLKAFHAAMRKLRTDASTGAECLAAIDSALTSAKFLFPNDGQQIEIELLNLACQRVMSARIFERKALALLVINNTMLDDQGWRDNGLSLPRMLRRAGNDSRQRWLPKDLIIDDEASHAWADAIAYAQHEATNEFPTFTIGEALASIRCLILICTHRTTRLGYDNAQVREAYFHGAGLALWSRLLVWLEARGSGLDPDSLLARRGQQLVLLHLEGEGQAGVIAPTDIASRSAEQTGRQSINSMRPGAKAMRVVHGPIPNASYKDDVDVIKRYEPLLEPLPIALLPSLDDIDKILSTLRGEFPWATEVVDMLAHDMRTVRLFGSEQLLLSPLLLVGRPGSGKSRFARRLAEVLGLPFQPIPLGGSHDQKQLLGTARGWGGGTPTALLNPMLSRGTASSLVLLDEIDKATSNGAGGAPVTSALLGLLEPETSSRWYDCFLQTTCDLSRISFVATSNSLLLPQALLTRFRCVYMPEPKAEHHQALVGGILTDLAREWQLSVEVFPQVPPWVYERPGLNARSLKAVVRMFLHEWAELNLQRDRLH